jgi:hypothetical protein
MKLMSFKSPESMSAAFLSVIMMLTFFVSSSMILVEIFNRMTKKDKNGKNDNSSFTDTLIASIIDTVMKSFIALKDYVVKVAEEFRRAITPSDMINNGNDRKDGDDSCGGNTDNSTGSFNKIFNMLFYVLSLPLYLCFLPFMLIPIVFFIIGLVCVCLPFFASVYSSFNFAYELSLNSITKMNDFIKNINVHYLSILLALFVFFLILKDSGVLMKDYDSNISLNIVSNITNLILVLVVLALYTYLYYITKEKVNNKIVLDTNDKMKMGVPLLIGFFGVAFEALSTINEYKMAKNNE